MERDTKEVPKGKKMNAKEKEEEFVTTQTRWRNIQSTLTNDERCDILIEKEDDSYELYRDD